MKLAQRSGASAESVFLALSPVNRRSLLALDKIFPVRSGFTRGQLAVHRRTEVVTGTTASPPETIEKLRGRDTGMSRW
jgi:hypothetical protein